MAQNDRNSGRFLRAVETSPRRVNTPTTAYTTGSFSGDGGGGGMDPRVDVLENEVKHINKSLDQISGDFRDFRKEVTDEFRALRKEMTEGFRELRAEGKSHFRWLLGVIVVPIVIAALKYIGVLPFHTP